MAKTRGTSKVVHGRWPALTALAVALVALPGRSDGQVKAIAAGSPPSEAPLSLTASDGTGLQLTSLSARVVVEEPLAFTELQLAFHNPEDRVREGRFRITLPPGAVISRFAMKIDGRFQEGEVVELQAARQAYEDFLHRRQDPALMETEAGNEFSARVFPIPARATKELIVSYSQELTRTGEPYRLPLRGLPRLGALRVRALVAQAAAGGSSNLGGTRARQEVVQLDRDNFTPDRDFEVVLPASNRIGLRHENLVVARVRPLDEKLPPDPVRGLLVLFDTSASRALGFHDQVARLSALVTSLRGPGGDMPLTVAAFDQTVEVVYSGTARGFGAAAEQKLRHRRALGASDLSKALGWVAARTLGVSRLLLVTDGVATAGQQNNAGLRAQVKALAGRGIERMDVLAVGGIRDDDRLAALVSSGLARAGVVLPAASAPAEQARRLNLATRSGLSVVVEGAAWVWPQRLDGVQPGDEVLVYADLPAAQPLKLAIAGRPVATSGGLSPAPRPLLERAWVKARLARLMSQRDAASTGDPDLAEALRKQVIELSVRHRVLSPFTAMLVLETEHDYRRFGIERRALADILTVGPSGIEVLDRHGVPSIAAPVMGRLDVPAERALRPEAPADKGATGRATRDDRMAQRTRQAESEAKKESGDPGEGMVSSRPSTPAPMPSARPPAAAAPAAPPPPAAATPPAPEPASAPALAAAAPEEESDGVEGGVEGGVGSVASGGGRPSRRPRAVAAKAARAGAPMAAPPRPRSVSDDPLDGLLREQPARRRAQIAADESAARGEAPYDGRFAELMALLARGQKAEAMARALAWYEGQPGDVLALVAIGEAAEATADTTLAARAYGSIIDLFPGRADLRRFAGNRLERVRGADALALAIDSYRQAVEQRPDHPAGHRLLAFALVKAGRAAEAFAALEVGLGRRYPDGRFAGVGLILAEDLGLVAEAWARSEPARAGDIRQRLRRAGGREERQASLRFVLSWETDANDVDFHIHDARGGHAYYSQRRLASGGELYADVTTGYGPECFTVRTPAGARAYPYKLQAHYYRRGPMGYGMGKLQIIAHDGRGGLSFEERPFVVMRDGAYVDLGTVATPKSMVVSSAARPGTVLSPLRR